MKRLLIGFVLLAAGCSSAPSSPASPTTLEAAPTSVHTTGAPTTTVAVQPWAAVVVGDFGDASPEALGVADAVAAWVADHPETTALITTGDNFYIDDVAAAWTGPYGWVAGTGIAVEPVPGNHDIQNRRLYLANVAAFGAFPAWRTVEVGSLTFVLLDSNQLESPQQREWLAEQAAELTGTPWVAVFHHPWMSCSRHGSTPQVEALWGDQLDRAALVLNGHDHNYQRFHRDGGWSVVTGGGGRQLYPVTECGGAMPPREAAVAAFHFLVIEGGSGGVTATAIGVDGAIIDQFVVAGPDGALSERP